MSEFPLPTGPVERVVLTGIDTHAAANLRRSAEMLLAATRRVEGLLGTPRHEQARTELAALMARERARNDGILALYLALGGAVHGEA